MKIERYGCTLREVKFSSEKAKIGTFSGYGAVFNNIDSYGDMIQQGAFKETLQAWEKRGKYPPMLLQHGGGYFGGSSDDLVPIGKWTKMEEDDHGLAVEGELFGLSTDRGTYIYESMKEGVLDGMSIGYIPVGVEYGQEKDDPDRTLTKIDLMELSVVTFPANSAARIDAVKAAMDITERDFERWLTRDAGLSRSEAHVVINEGFKALKATRDAGPDVSDLRKLLARMSSSSAA